jgi:hypothetical protein
MRAAAAAVFLLHVLITGCGSGSADKRSDGDPVGEALTAVRVEAKELYPSVGQISNGRYSCSGAVIAHGLFVTAKHCFPDYKDASQIVNYSISFSTIGVLDGNVYKIMGTDIAQIVFDGPQTDIAYVIYNKSVSQQKVALDVTTVQKKAPVQGEAVILVGYPRINRSPALRLVSDKCQFSGKSGSIPPLPKDAGYDGMLYDTSCLAWWGNSGGPAFKVDEAGKVRALIGVVTHTFDIKSDGSLDETRQGRDSYGSYVSTTAISVFSEAQRIDEILSQVGASLVLTDVNE